MKNFKLTGKTENQEALRTLAERQRILADIRRDYERLLCNYHPRLNGGGGWPV